MSTYDLKRLETAIQYIRRMSAGRNPVTNKPAPENEVLGNVNVHRCLKFIDEVLTDVHGSGGVVGQLPQRERSAKIPPSELFPYETLQQYRYLQDQQISFFLKQLEEYLPEGQKMPVAATTITGWLRENGYLEKRAINDTGKENSVPTRKGEELGMYSEKGGIYPNEYYRVFYNEKAQRFLIENFRRILTEYEAIRERSRREKKSEAAPRSRRQSSAPAYGAEVPGEPSYSVPSYNAPAQFSAPRQRGGALEAPAQFSAPRQHGGAPEAPAQFGAPRQRGGSPEPPAQFSAPFETAPAYEPAPAEDLPQEYYDMLSSGWDRMEDEGLPW